MASVGSRTGEYMTANRAKEFLLKHFQFLKEMWKPHPDYNVLESIKIAISAIEKQIPRRPVKGEPYYWVDSVKMQGRYRDVRKKAYQTICPICSHTVLAGTNFCRDCGQRLDWSDEE